MFNITFDVSGCRCQSVVFFRFMFQLTAECFFVGALRAPWSDFNAKAKLGFK